MVGAAVTSLVIAVAGAVFTTWFAGTHRSVRRARSGVWARMVAVALVVTVLTMIIGALVLAPALGAEAGAWVSRATGSAEQWSEATQRAWPYLKAAWRAAR